MRILAVLTITAGMINKRDTTKLLHYFIIFNPKGNLICSKGLLIKIIGKYMFTFARPIYEFERKIVDYGIRVF